MTNYIITAYSHPVNKRIKLFTWTRDPEDGVALAKEQATGLGIDKYLKDYRAEPVETFEERYHDIVPLEYDFDRDHLTHDQTNALVELIRSMPESRETTEGQVTHYEGWCKQECTFIDLAVNNPTGIGFQAFCGSENLMIEDKATVELYKAAFTGHPVE